MAFGYEYLMVYLPGICPDSFLLFVHNPAGSTKLRDYSSGRENQLKSTVTVSAMLSQTAVGTTRFYYEPHRTNGDGIAYWAHVTRELNGRWLPEGTAKHPHAPRLDARPARSATHNRALRGSRRQLQDYVNERPDLLSKAVLDALPPRLRELDAAIRWVSPLARNAYMEYRDADFLRAIDATEAAAQLVEFWPPMGPCWDALGLIADPAGRLAPGAILVEAKSHIPEIYGSGCLASARSRPKIERALAETKAWLGVKGDPDWLGALYQYANRLAHLYFLREKVRKPAWLVNLYFVDDPIGPTTEEEWRPEIGNVKASLGIASPVPNLVDVFLPAMVAYGGALWTSAG